MQHYQQQNLEYNFKNNNKGYGTRTFNSNS